MKTRFLVIQLLVLVLGAELCRAATNEAVGPKVTLKGLLDLGSAKLAFLESSLPIPVFSSLVLGEGERVGDIEVVRVSVPQRRVSLRVQGELIDVTFDSEASFGKPIEPSSANPPTGNNVAVCLDRVGLGQILSLYVRLANRTVLRPTQLPAIELSLHTDGNISSPDLMTAIASALKEKGVLIQPQGDKFLVVAGESDVARVTPETKETSDALASALAQATGLKADELLPAGMVNFPQTDLNQVLQIYQDLVNRTAIRPTALPAQQIKFFNYTALTRSELIYALAATLALNGISVMPAGEKFVFVFPTFQKDMATEILARKPSAIAAGTNSIPAGSINLRAAALPVVAGLYREISGQALELNADLPKVSIIFKSQTALTPDEALQGLEYALAWNRLVIEKVENKLTLKPAGGNR